MKKLRSIFLSILLLNSQIISSQPWLVGVCAEGGNQFGTIMKYTAGDTLLSDVYKFPGIPGNIPFVTQCTDINGKIYGMTSRGGAYGYGIIYEYDYNTGVYEQKFDFTPATSAGGVGALVSGNNGFLYGVTSVSNFFPYGTVRPGVIFEYDYINNSGVVKVEFNNSMLGINPSGSLLLASNNKFYGVTFEGGVDSAGVLFEYDHINNLYFKKHDFNISDGKRPGGNLVEAPNGKLYGLTNAGGLYNQGVIFEYDLSTNTFLKKIDLDHATGMILNNWLTGNSLVLAANGKMYAMTRDGGTYYNGILFEYDYINNIFTKKFDFILGEPWGHLYEASNGLMYGMTSEGGIHGDGVLFEYDYNNNVLTDLFDMNTPINGGTPCGSLVQASNGHLYGSASGGENDRGVFFEYDLANSIYTKITEFGTAIEGYQPTNSPIQAPNGKFYGLTSYGGANNSGVIYEYDYPNNSYTKKFDCPGSNQSSGEFWGGLLLASNGKFYGTTKGDRIFEYDYVNNTFVNKVIFTLPTVARPTGALIEATNGKMYGMSGFGGSNYDGVIYDYNPANNAVNIVYDFDSTYGTGPAGGLIQATNGKLYGMTSAGGSFGKGVLFEYDYNSDTYTKKVDFTDSTGTRPYGTLMQASNEKIYGMTTAGGSNNGGVIFEFDPVTDVYTRKINMSFPTGSWPTGALLETSNGKLYGMTGQGGVGMGVIFEFDFITNTYIKMVDLYQPLTGYNPVNALAEFHCLPPVMSATGPVSFCQGGSVTLTVDVDSSSTIQWNRNSIPIAGANNTSLLVTTAGTYTVTVSNVLCSPLTSNSIRVTIPCISPFDPGEKNSGFNETNNLFSLDVFYDPASESIKLSAVNLKGNSYILSVFDNTGRLVVSEKGDIALGELSRHLHWSSYATGIYMIRFSTEMEHGVYKIMK